MCGFRSTYFGGCRCEQLLQLLWGEQQRLQQLCCSASLQQAWAGQVAFGDALVALEREPPKPNNVLVPLLPVGCHHWLASCCFQDNTHAAASEVTTDNTLLLQNMGELMEHTELLDKAAACEDPYER